jgi:hypothetical protein
MQLAWNLRQRIKTCVSWLYDDMIYNLFCLPHPATIRTIYHVIDERKRLRVIVGLVLCGKEEARRSMVRKGMLHYELRTLSQPAQGWRQPRSCVPDCLSRPSFALTSLSIDLSATARQDVRIHRTTQLHSTKQEWRHRYPRRVDNSEHLS